MQVDSIYWIFIPLLSLVTVYPSKENFVGFGGTPSLSLINVKTCLSNDKPEELLKTWFPGQKWLAYSESYFIDLHQALIQNDVELLALRELYTVHIFHNLFKSYFDEFRLNFCFVDSPWDDFSKVLFLYSRKFRITILRARIALLAIAIKKFKLGGFVKMVKECQVSSQPSESLELRHCNFIVASEYLYKKLYQVDPLLLFKDLKAYISECYGMGEVEPLYGQVTFPQQVEHLHNAYKFYLVNEIWKWQVEAPLLHPFCVPQLVELGLIFEKNKFKKALLLIGKILSARHPLNFYTLSKNELITSFIEEFIHTFAINDNVTRSFLRASTIHHEYFMIIVDSMPTEWAQRDPSLIKKNSILKFFQEAWDLLRFDGYTFNLQMCLNLNYYCNPTMVRCSSLTEFPNWIQAHGVHTQQLSILQSKYPELYTLLYNQPWLAALAVTPSAINDALLFAPKVPIANALVTLLNLYLQRNPTSREEKWYKNVEPKLKQPIILLDALLKQNGFKNNPLHAQALVLDGNSAPKLWAAFFEPSD